MLFFQVPTARTRDEHGGFVIEFVRFSVLLQGDVALDRVAQIQLTLDHVFPGRAVGVFKIGHEGRRAAVHGIDDHFAIGGAGDFNAAVLQVFWQWCDHPATIADMLGLGQKIRQLSGIELFLACIASGKQILAGGFKLACQLCKKGQCIGCQHRGELWRDSAANGEAGGKAVSGIHEHLLKNAGSAK